MRVLLLFLMLTVSFSSHALNQSFISLSYHDIGSDAESNNDQNIMLVKSSELVSQFSWLRENGYKPVSLEQIIVSRTGGDALPDKAILLTFDDGYRSVYTHVFPLLKLFNYPAVIALVGTWMDVAAGEMVAYGEILLPREHFLMWNEVREMVDSGLVEVASHSYNLHQGIIANPQGNSQPAATARYYDQKDMRYETDKAYKARLLQDLKRSSAQIRHHTGKAPRVLVWPYGAYNQISNDIAKKAGMPYVMSLDSGGNRSSDLSNINRVLMKSGAKLVDLIWALQPVQEKPVRLAHVDLDYVYDTDPVRQEKNIGLLLDRIKSLRINTVYLQAYADPDGDGHADALYYPNRHLPMRADLFNRVAWQLRTRSGVRVYAWLPVLAYQLKADHFLEKSMVQAITDDNGNVIKESYRRLSPYNPHVRKFVGDIYEDLAINTQIAGLLFHDDAYLSDFEDNSLWAKKVYHDEWGLPNSISVIRQNPALMEKWTKHKTATLIEFTHMLRDRVRDHQPTIKTARNIYAQLIMNPQSETWFAQSFSAFIENYDYTAIMAMPYMEGAEDPKAWLEELVARVVDMTPHLNKVVIELQSIDWRNQTKIDSSVLAQQMRTIHKLGIVNFGYYPDDFISGHPNISVIYPELSLSTYPYID